jgi:hypothetical protein
MSLNDKIEKLLTDFGLNLTVDTKSSLRKKLDERAERGSTYKGVHYKGRKRTSRLEASALALPIKYTSDSIKFTFQMNDYWDIVDGGRRASSVSKEGQSKIENWSGLSGFAENIRLSDLAARKKRSKNPSKVKKMPFDKAKKAAAFLVARSLKNKKLEPTNFFSEVVKDGRVEELQNKLSDLIKTDIIINIV